MNLTFRKTNAKETQLAQRFVDSARTHIGYRALPGLGSTYGLAVGYPGQEWNGSFLTAVARDCNVQMPSTVSTASALAELVADGRNFRVPRVGDLAFYAFGTGPFSQPHIGLVSSTADYARTRSFTAIEGQVSSGMPRGNQDANGVFERTRFESDVLLFARPRYTEIPVKTDDVIQPDAWVRTGMFLYGKLDTAKSNPIERVQLALAATVGLHEAERSRYDAPTRAAYAKWQRRCGLTGADASGMPDKDTLTRLGTETNLFYVRD